MHGSHILARHECFNGRFFLSRKRIAHKALLVFCFLALALSVAACGDQRSASSPPVMPAAPTQNTFQLTTPPPVATVTFQVYTGNGLSLNYPQNWVVRSAGALVSLSDASGTYNMTVNFQPNANGQVTANQLANTNLASIKKTLSHPQSIAVSPTISLAGTTWSQRAVSGTTLSNGVQVEREVIVLATNHPAHAADTRGVVLIYMGVKQSFTQASHTYFTPMLRTFKFVA